LIANFVSPFTIDVSPHQKRQFFKNRKSNESNIAIFVPLEAKTGKLPSSGLVSGGEC
jgi:hypothetical protein